MVICKWYFSLRFRLWKIQNFLFVRLFYSVFKTIRGIDAIQSSKLSRNWVRTRNSWAHRICRSRLKSMNQSHDEIWIFDVSLKTSNSGRALKLIFMAWSLSMVIRYTIFLLLRCVSPNISRSPIFFYAILGILLIENRMDVTILCANLPSYQFTMYFFFFCVHLALGLGW